MAWWGKGRFGAASRHLPFPQFVGSGGFGDVGLVEVEVVSMTMKRLVS